MTNFDIYENLVSMAKISYRDLINAYVDGVWNAVIRRSQEVVELYLKAMLKLMCIEYPKSHDVGIVFTRACIKKGISIDHSELTKIEKLSNDLTEKRGPAFYMEEIYTQEDAEKAKAKADAEFVLNFAKAMSVKLKGNL